MLMLAKVGILHVQFHHPFTAVFGVITHSVPTVDQFLRVEWTARIPTVYVEFGSARYSTVHGARCALHAASHQHLRVQ